MSYSFTIIKKARDGLDSLPDGAFGIMRDRGQTAVLRCNGDLDRYQAGLSHGHRYDIRRLERLGCIVSRHRDQDAVLEFASCYHGTMMRVGADATYLFSEEYFRGFGRATDFETTVYKARLDGQVAAMGLFLRRGSILTYHLSSSVEGVTKYSATKLLLDRAIKDAISSDVHWIHLGGGLGAKSDSLYAFKKGFGAESAVFRTWEWILRPDDYAALTAACRPVDGFRGDYFPSYRQPGC